jgi:hypothetical protein
MDCARLERLASHCLTEQEFECLFESEHPEISPLVSTLAECLANLQDETRASGWTQDTLVQILTQGKQQALL